MRSAPFRHVSLALFGGELYVFFTLHLIQLHGSKELACHDIKLRGRRGAFGIDIVACTCCCQLSAFMKIFRIDDLSRNSISQITVAKLLLGRRIFRCHIPRLNHKLLDHPVKQQTIVLMLIH